LGVNQLAGNLPPELWTLTDLQYLNLSFNELTGGISSSIGNLTALHTLFLDGNNFTGEIPTSIGNLSDLDMLYLQYNQFTSLPPNIAKTIGYFSVRGNNLTFESRSLEPYVPNTFISFTYSPQANILVSPNIHLLNQGDDLNLTVSVGGEHNQYQWYKDGTALSSISSSPNYSKLSLTAADSGTYVCHITNTVVTDLTLYTEDITVTVVPDSDNDGLPDSLENGSCTDPNDADTDDDGIPDGVEDVNHNCFQDPGETHPCKIDSDGDGIQDGTELGYTLSDVGPDTDLSKFQPDLDPATKTNPLNSDSDGDGIPDGVEDTNHNGRKDPGETDPNQKDNSVIYVEPEGNCGGTRTPCYRTIQAALDAAENWDTIQAAKTLTPEEPVWDKIGTVTISGGWKTDFSGQDGTTSIYAPKATGGGGVKIQPNVKIIAP